MGQRGRGPRLLQADRALVDLLDVSAGIYESMEWIFTMQGTEPGSLLQLARMVKDAVDVPVMAISRLGWMLEDAARAVKSGEIDFVAMGRTQLADAELVNKSVRGEPSGCAAASPATSARRVPASRGGEHSA